MDQQAATSETTERQPSLFALIREDLRVHRGAWMSPGFHAMVMYRFGRWRRRGRIRRVLFAPFYKVMHIWVRNVYGIEIYDTCTIGRRFRIGHQSGIVIHKFATFGDDCSIRQGVTLGVGNVWTRGRGPIIGNRVSIGVNAVIVGEPVIGDDATIGPNVVISNNIPAGTTVFAPPPRMIRSRPQDDSNDAAAQDAGATADHAGPHNRRETPGGARLQPAGQTERP